MTTPVTDGSARPFAGPETQFLQNSDKLPERSITSLLARFQTHQSSLNLKTYPCAKTGKGAQSYSLLKP